MTRPRLEVADVLRRYGETFLERCRAVALGGQVEQCDHCGHRRLCYQSCRDRHCPKCQWSAHTEWLERPYGELLDCEYHHVVFTVSAEIAVLYT